jgi:hypothetical protein
MKLSTLALAAALAVSGGVASAETLGQRVDSGQISPAAFAQLVAGSGVTEQEARDLTLNEIALRKTDSN